MFSAFTAWRLLLDMISTSCDEPVCEVDETGHPVSQLALMGRDERVPPSPEGKRARVRRPYARHLLPTPIITI